MKNFVGPSSEESVPKFTVDLGEVLHETGIIGGKTCSMFSETAQATEAGAVTPGATETGADTHGAMEAGAVIHGEPIHEVLVITEEAVTGPKQKKRKYIPDYVEG